jgi:prolyl 4-hydroxylase
MAIAAEIPEKFRDVEKLVGRPGLASLKQKLRARLIWLYERRYFFLHRVIKNRVPQFNLSYLPDGFTVTKVGRTGITIADGFCTQEEAQSIIEIARAQLGPAGILANGKFIEHPKRQCETALVFGPGKRDPRLLPIACRAAAMTGLPYTHVEGVYVTRYKEGGFYLEHIDYGNNFRIDRLYTVLLYLNDMTQEQGGSTVFPNLNVGVQPRVGRAVAWTNMNPDGSFHPETSHAAMPVKAGAEKWAIQFWFRAYKMFEEIDHAVPQATLGVPLSETDRLPDGARYIVRQET